MAFVQSHAERQDGGLGCRVSGYQSMEINEDFWAGNSVDIRIKRETLRCFAATLSPPMY